MTDPIRDHARPTDHPSGADRRVDALLIEGLEAFFEGRFEDAIHLWTRVLFLDRNHARARAYIDRARAVQAEGHRETDELLHRGLGALARPPPPPLRPWTRAG